MEVLALLTPFVLLGVAILFIAFSGGPGAARKAYVMRGGRAFKLTIPLVYLALGVVVPAIVLVNRGEAAGAQGSLESAELSGEAERGKNVFRQQCSTCHNLDAVNARGVTGPDLDEIGEVSPERILEAIENGGTGQRRMPAGLVEGEEAQAVATYVSRVASR